MQCHCMTWLELELDVSRRERRTQAALHHTHGRGVVHRAPAADEHVRRLLKTRLDDGLQESIHIFALHAWLQTCLQIVMDSCRDFEQAPILGRGLAREE